MIDTTKIKVGDKVRLRYGKVKTVTNVDLTDSSTYPVDVYWEGNDEISYTQDGFYWDDREPDRRDIVEIIPAKTSEKEPIDATKIKVGDKVLLRNGQVRTVMEIKIDDHLEYPVNITFVGKNGYRTSYAPSGKFWVDRKDPWDILEINPAKTSEKEPIDATKIKVGDKVRLRNGETHTVTEATPSVYPVLIRWHGDGHNYTLDGQVWEDYKSEQDILEINPAEASEKTTDDIVTILSFSESEDNIISSLAGLQLTDRQIQGLNAMLTAFSDEAKRAWGWNLDVYIRNAPRTINRKQLEDERENYAWPPNPLTGDVIGLMSLTADEDDE